MLKSDLIKKYYEELAEDIRHTYEQMMHTGAAGRYTTDIYIDETDGTISHIENYGSAAFYCDEDRVFVCTVRADDPTTFTDDLEYPNSWKEETEEEKTARENRNEEKLAALVEWLCEEYAANYCADSLLDDAIREAEKEEAIAEFER